MTPTEVSEIAGDHRRATAALLHFSKTGDDGMAGVSAILQEAAEADRITPLFLALLSLAESLRPELFHTAAGLEVVNKSLMFHANLEQEATE